MTTNIREDGKRISIHNLGQIQLEVARKEIEEKYGLVKAGSTPKQALIRILTRPYMENQKQRKP